ncbi:MULTISPECIES: type III restriction endonuclease [unclassified Streptococcus]|uniref:type III restriction endonuclease n=1 Tax=unclassified Streptococcus TaxID=2608887 RepID=UPI001071C149|nr:MULTISPECIES: type III restriction endonuclease [unclassified Streptococcus]MBF0786673.1 type III restriction endonuclease [Streptococcus sp. 19428wC2_LYSM12]MCQ9211704.1 type III restriction endonuclease [Streptococcus sp. B01]MCQ9213107.1 type III restriction endonuclease [Streptococcus sp. O1]TFV06425.1 type III restriction endonuclease [Streptococcus sp. LYSM12]
MTKLETLEKQRTKAQERREDFLAKAKKEEEKLKELEVQIILAKHEERSDYLAKHHLTWADIEKALAEGRLKGDTKHVPFNQPDTGHDNNLQE